MFQNLDIFRTAIALARHAGTRQAASAQNIANADTPGYRGVDPPDFSDSFAAAGPRAYGSAMRATRAAHLNGQLASGSSASPLDDAAAIDDLRLTKRRAAADPNGNTVALETEMLTAVEALRAHDRALAIYRSNLTLLRTSLGN